MTAEHALLMLKGMKRKRVKAFSYIRVLKFVINLIVSDFNKTVNLFEIVLFFYHYMQMYQIFQTLKNQFRNYFIIYQKQTI